MNKQQKNWQKPQQGKDSQKPQQGKNAQKLQQGKESQKPQQGKSSQKSQQKSQFKQKQSGNAQKQVRMPADWYYMNQKAITVTDIKACLPEHYDLEIWPEAGVLEIGVAEKVSVDFEAAEIVKGDPYTDAFLEEHQVVSLFYVSLKQDAFAQCESVLKEITKNLGGFFCGDTDDFSPVIK